MAIKSTSKLDHWEFFLAVEEDIYRLSRFIEFSEKNFSCYSIELARLLLSICAEVDVVSKLICLQKNPASAADNIFRYRQEISPAYPKIHGIKIKLHRYGLELAPWQNWGSQSNPDWWGDHTDVKHHRHTHFSKASLSNVLNSAAGLFVLLLYYYQPEAQHAKLKPNPLLFTTEDEYLGGLNMDDQTGELIRDYVNLI